jgi:predicted dehydrogenase
MNLGIIGCGNISSTYLKNFTKVFHNVKITAVADQNKEAARRQAEEFGVENICKTNEELMARPDVDIVLILTNPASHSVLLKQALLAGKHTYCEKPFALSLEEAQEVLDIARKKNLYVGCAPDTMLGHGIQTCKKILEDDWIGKPIGIQFNVAYFGPETWHPNPAFLYLKGAGPLLDIGPYYIACLTYLLGPISQVSSFTSITYPERTVLSPERYGEKIKVEVPTSISGIIKFENGTLGSMNISFDGAASEDPRIEIIGTEGTIVVPNPDTQKGDILFRKLNRSKRSGDPKDPISVIPPVYNYYENCRGIGVSEMASSIQKGRPSRLNGDFAYHTLEVILALQNPPASGVTKIKSSFKPLTAFPIGLQKGEVD